MLYDSYMQNKLAACWCEATVGVEGGTLTHTLTDTHHTCLSHRTMDVIIADDQEMRTGGGMWLSGG